MSVRIDAGSVVCYIEGDGSGWKRELDAAVDNMNKFQREISGIQRALFQNFATIGKETSNRIRMQLEWQEQLEWEKFQATHSRKEIELREMEMYYAELRRMFKDHQQMLTQINETEAARRAEIEKKYKESFNPMAHLGIVRSYLRAAGVLYTISSVSNSIEEAHRALRKGESSLYAFVRALPIVGRIAENFTELIKEVSGFNEQMERAEEHLKRINFLNQMSEELIGRREKARSYIDVDPEIEELNRKHEENLSLLKKRREEINKLYPDIEGKLKELEEKRKEILSIQAVDPSVLRMQGMIIAQLGKKIEDLTNAKSELLQIDKLINEEMKVYNEEIKKINEKKIIDFKNKLEEQIRALTLNEKEMLYYEASLLKMNSAQRDSVYQLIETIERLKEERNARAENARAVQLQREALKQWAESAMKSSMTPMQNYQETVKKANEAVKEGILTQQQALEIIRREWNDTWREMNRELLDFVEQIAREMKTPQQELLEIQQKINQAVQQGLITQKAGYEYLAKKREEITKQMDRDIISFSEQVKKSLKTPLEELEEYRKNLEKAVEKGYLTREEAEKAYRKEYEETQRKMREKERENLQEGSFRSLTGWQSISGISIHGIESLSFKQERTNQILERIERNTRMDNRTTVN